LLAPLLAGLFFGAMAGQGFSAVGRINLQAVLVALQDPLSLFAQRSPGKRQSGRLHPLKSAKGRPHERVLASVRDRPAAPTAGNPGPVGGDIPGSSVTIPIIPPQYEMPPEGPIITGQPPFPVPPIPFVPIDNPGPPITPPPGTPPPGTPVPPPGTPVPPPGTPVPPPGTPTPPPGTPTPPPETPTPPPGTPTPPPETPPGITVPEPASWTMMLLGVLALGVARRRLRKPIAVRWRSDV